MNTKKPSTMTYLIIILIIGLALLTYFYLNGSKPGESLTLGEESGADQAVGMRVLNLLNEISSLSIDRAFFTDPSYSTLRDYTVEIPSLSVGRSNPFAVVPGMESSSSSR